MMRVSPSIGKVALFVLATFMPFPGNGQSTSGSISGTVLDSEQASIAGATVTLTEPSKSVTLTTNTNVAGGFIFAQVSPGNYTLTVENPGFKKLERTGVALSANDKLDIGGLAMVLG